MARFALILDLRAQLYFWIAFGTSFLAQTEAIVQINEWSYLQWGRTVLASLIAGFTALRAYIDQSISRRDETES